MDKQFDEKLLIRTKGIREWRGDVPYNRCESTPYRALERLFDTYKIDDEDSLVDFGAGRGRVAFYVHNKFNIPITGVELNETTLDEALANKRRYRSHAFDLESPIRFEYGYAENYDVDERDNKFYFFNPFKAEIFEEVVENILKSARSEDKEVDIILYYPMPGYKEYLRENTDFELINKLVIDEVNDKREKFLIYRFDPRKKDEEELDEKESMPNLVLKRRHKN